MRALQDPAARARLSATRGARCCRSRRPRSRCSRCSSTGTCSPRRARRTCDDSAAAPRPAPENDAMSGIDFADVASAGDLRVPRRRDRGRDGGARRRAARGRRLAVDRGQPPLQPPVVGRRGPRAPARRRGRRDRREQARDRRLQPAAQRRDREDRRSAARAAGRRRARGRRMAQLGDRRLDGRPAVDPRAEDLPHAGPGDARRRVGRASCPVRATSSPASCCSARISRAASTRCSTRAAEGRAYWRVYRQFKMYNDAALNPYLYGGKR